MSNKSLIYLISLVFFINSSSLFAADRSEVSVWETALKDTYFKGQEIREGQSIIEIKVPRRAEDAGIVPVSIHAHIPQTPERYIEKVYVFVDKNPQPLAGTFTLTPEMGRADLSMRLRINEYTNVRAVAQLNTGELHMHSGFTRASGGCTQPPPFLQLKQARENIGKMKFRTFASKEMDNAQLAQLMVSHPNVTGLQLDQRTRAYIPPEYVTKIEISYNDTHIMTAETGISISEDPSFRFFFKPGQKGKITAVMEDNKGRVITREFEIN